MLRKPFIFLLINTFACTLTWATHQRAGEITYRHLSGLMYEFTITSYTYTPSPADRPEIEVSWGDGSTSIIQRYSKTNMENDISKNIYIANHSFPSSGSYNISFEDPNRNAGIVNIPNSVNIPFFLQTTLIINSFMGSNSSPILLNPPIDNGCYQIPYYHNPGAYDPDGDSLSYHLVSCMGYGGEVIPGYSLPAASNFIDIDPVSGLLTWDAPMTVGEYNIAIEIREWRAGRLIGKVLRDMQITIAPCTNQPPNIFCISDTCVYAGDILQFPVRVEDATSSRVTITASGEPFEVAISPAVFPTRTEEPPFSVYFVWQTTCEHLRLQNYSVLFKAMDNGPVIELSKYKTVNIRVILRKPENLTAFPQANRILLNWSPSNCTNVAGYKVYKRRNSNPFEVEQCQTGMPENTGYQLITITSSRLDTSFIDYGTVMPTYHGNEYCYRIVAFTNNGTESVVSDEVCTAIINDAPLITHVDVDVTDSLKGKIIVKWQQPPELDSLSSDFDHYTYFIYRKSSQETNFQLIREHQPFSDTTFIDSLLNTLNLIYFYQIYLMQVSGDNPPITELVEKSDPASSVFVSISSSDKTLHLSWNEQVPWNNTNYIIYRYNNETHQFDSLNKTVNQYYTDRNLINGQNYCYYVLSEGNYFVPNTIDSLYNRSQIICEIPFDHTPPEIAGVDFNTDCQYIILSWLLKDEEAFGDIAQYNVYYKPEKNADFRLLISFENRENCYPDSCHYIIENKGIITGCFALSAIDTNGNVSSLSQPVCFDYDHCFDYRLPNVFTPNGDGFNDFFTPFPYSNVFKINIIIYNKWGQAVYKTENPDILWDGKNLKTHLEEPEGTYYYNCEVFVKTLSGDLLIPLHGVITMIR
jgi:gliding motility-associated-like protein